MSKVKRMAVLLFAMVMIIGGTGNVFANVRFGETSVKDEDFESTASVTEYEWIDGSLYYFELTPEYTISIGVHSQIVEYAIKYHNEELMLQSGQEAIDLSGDDDDYYRKVVQEYRSMLLDGELTVRKEKIVISKEDKGSARKDEPSRSLSNTQKTWIMNAVYAAGFPAAFTNRNIANLTEDGVYAKLYETVSYSLSEKSATWVAAGKVLSAVSTLLDISSSNAKKIIYFILNADGLWEVVSGQYAKKANVTMNDTKVVKIGTIQPYHAGRTVKWLATIGDSSAIVQKKSDHKDSDFNSNNAILIKGIENYINGVY